VQILQISDRIDIECGFRNIHQCDVVGLAQNRSCANVSIEQTYLPPQGTRQDRRNTDFCLKIGRCRAAWSCTSRRDQTMQRSDANARLIGQ